MTRTRSESRLLPVIILIIGLIFGGGVAAVCPIQCQCTEHSADCSRRGLSEYPSFNNANISDLDLSGNNFTKFPSQYSNLMKLNSLDLSDNFINKLDVDALKGFKSLRTLNLAKNLITSWTDINANVSFIYAPKLYTLNLSGNSLGSLGFSEGLISETLGNLDISSANIRTVDINLRTQLPKLRALTMVNNNLSQLIQFPQISYLRSLDLSNCSLKQFNLSYIYILNRLDLSHNPALNFSGMDLRDLIILDLSYCNLSKIDLSNFASVLRLSLRGNVFESINSITLANNSKLRNLDLSENNLTGIEKYSFNWLEELNLSKNKINQLNENIINGINFLRTLDLSHNNIQKLTGIESFGLETINLSYCNITTIDRKALSGLGHIREIDLSHNLISEIPDQMESTFLTKLDLSNCELSTIGDKSFQGFPELMNLNLNGNRLSNPVNCSSFRHNNYLEQIELGDNLWNCTCQYPLFLKFHKLLTSNQLKIMDQNDISCNSPICINEEKSNVWTIILLTTLGNSLLVLFFWYCLKIIRKRMQRVYRRDFLVNYNELNPMDPSN
ncbi:slit homolog 3 protein-like [Drosophila innubila]|uniref:slit homolog 3 protein-like n=1 Tax=Drosophila innubila TaxID=198719 RepID=UPI00148E7CDD|nr:slit homolog 3 protein-like [Drosophila innubila]